MVASQPESREFLFQLFDVLDTGALVARERYHEHSGGSLRAVVETFGRLSAGRSSAGDNRIEALAEGAVGVVPEAILTLGNSLYQCAGQHSPLFRTRSESLLAEPMMAAVGAWQHYRHFLQSQTTEVLDQPESADLRMRLLVAKSRSEGALAMGLYAAALAEDIQSHPETDARVASERLLDFLHPLVAWWPGHAAWLSAAALGQATAPAEPGQAGRQARDFLGRRVWQHQSHGLQLFLQAMQKDLEAAVTADTRQWALSLSETLQRAVKVTRELGKALHSGSGERMMANASRYLHLFGEMLAGWMWLRQANAAALKLTEALPDEQPFYRGKLQAARYFFHWTLPEVAQDLVLLQNQDTTCLDMRANWF